MVPEVGDYARLDQAPEGLDPETALIFGRCLGGVFRVAGFERGVVELEVGEAFGEKPYLRWIWIEPQFVTKCVDRA